MEDCVSISIGFAHELQPHVSRSIKNRMRSSSPGGCNISAHFLLPSAQPSFPEITFAPKKLPLELSDEFTKMREEIQSKTGQTSFELAARQLVAEGDFELLSRVNSTRMIHDWEGLCRFVVRHCKENFLSPESSSKRINWVFSRATTFDIAMVVRDYLGFIDDDVMSSLFGMGFPRDEKTVSAIKIALKSE